MRVHMLRGWIVGILAALVVLMSVVPAGAHAELAASDPQDGASLEAAPEELTFTFTEDVLPQGNAVTLTDVAAGSRLEVGPLRVAGPTVSVTWPDRSPAGEFRVAYRVVSADGHPIDGTITISVAQPVGAAAGSATPTSAARDTSEPPVTPEPVTVSAEPAPEAGGGGRPLGWVIGLVVAVLVGAGAGTWFWRRTR